MTTTQTPGRRVSNDLKTARPSESTTGRLWCSHVLIDGDWQRSVAIAIGQDGKIQSIEADQSRRDDIQLDGWVIPGVANLHSHAHQRAMTGLGERAAGGDSFWTWREAMYRTVARVTPDQLYNIARMLYLEMLDAGYTRVAEFQYLHHDPAGRPYANRAEMTLQCARAAADVGIGFTALPVLYRYGGFGEQPSVDGQKRFINTADGFLEIVDAFESGALASQNCGIAPHSLRAISPVLLGDVLASAGERVVHIHIAEQTKEVDDCLAWSGQRPVAWLLDNQSLNDRWVLIHATHMDEPETVGVANSGAIAGLCPTTEANLGDGFFNALGFLELGGRFGIGSDSHISVDPAEELRWLEYGQRLLLRGRNVLAGDDPSDSSSTHCGASLLREASASGARACDWGSGRIAVGEPADLIVLDSGHPRLIGRVDNDVLDSWIFSNAGNPVRDVVVAGSRVVDDRFHPERQQIVARFRETLNVLANE